MNNFKKILCILGLCAAISFFACEDKGPMERAGEKVDEAIEETGDKLEEAGDKAERAMD
ncbi:MAG: hypothetical protein K9N21_05315 [Deltaproteobacteria bacterium]|nr:hypothetical protein [Deltaproteobacteria bacterium]